LSKALPILGLFLDMPKMPNGGDLDFAPKVSGRAFGASMRMVVSPGHEEDGIMNMPCGQSGHPLSPHYRDQHKAWLDGIPTSFLPGETKYTLELVP
jgi:penicillin amidase